MKQLFICENHHYALLPWAKIRTQKENLKLLTFDHHTDTHEAFLDFLYNHPKLALSDLVAKTNYNDCNSVKSAIDILKNDEHIDTALKIGIIEKAFVVSFDGSFDKPSSNEFTEFHNDMEREVNVMLGLEPMPKDLTYPESNIYVIGTSNYLDDYNCISDDFLTIMLERIEIMSGIDILNTDYILDIDLDYFHTYSVLDESNSIVFKNIVSRACAITIATEPNFAQKGIDTEQLLERLLAFIKQENNFEIIDMRNS
nr:UPF0489 family protein [uncultured Anaerosporobacter sp.]